MGQPGVDVMICMLFGNAKSVATIGNAVGKTITALRLGDDNALHFELSGGGKMLLRDGGQSCCELRYMRTDDNLDYYVGSTLLGVEIKAAPNQPCENGEHEVQFHEVQFLEVKTDRGVFTLSNHVEHTGYYGGFCIVAEEE